MTRRVRGLIVVVAVGLGTAIGIVLAGVAPAPAVGPVASTAPSAVAQSTDGTSATVSPTAPTPTPTPAPPTPAPTPTTVAAPLSGRLVEPAVADRRVLAVMVDDHWNARPQSGFNAASVVWHAPAEGGIPRYMLLFGDELPDLVGPVRSARQYYIAWAAEWRSLYVHSGGSPDALRTLRSDGQGELVYDADEFRWGGRYLWRTTDRFAPHNVYTDGEQLRALAERLGADDVRMAGAWRFGPELPLTRRVDGGTIDVPYTYNRVAYAYDRATNRYVRSVTDTSLQVDAADGRVVAPRNVVVLFVRFGPLNDGHPEKLRLEAEVVGSGRALVATNGGTFEATWRKDSLTEPTRLLDAKGRPIVLAVGQTFVQVVPVGTAVTVTAGEAVPRDPASVPVPR